MLCFKYTIYAKDFLIFILTHLSLSLSRSKFIYSDAYLTSFGYLISISQISFPNTYLPLKFHISRYSEITFLILFSLTFQRSLIRKSFKIYLISKQTQFQTTIFSLLYYCNLSLVSFLTDQSVLLIQHNSSFLKGKNYFHKNGASLSATIPDLI